MSREYHISTPAFAPGGIKSVVECVSGSIKQFRLKNVNLSSADVAGATTVGVFIKRITAGGTASAITARPDVFGDTAFSGTPKYNDTVEPTKTVDLAVRKWNIITECDIPCDYWFNAAGGDGFCVYLDTDPAASIVVDCTIEEF